MRNVPLIYQGCAGQEGKAHPVRSPPNNPPETTDKSEQKGDLFIHDVWKRGTVSIHYMRVVNIDALYYQNKSPEMCLQTAEKSKKKKYLESCLQKRCHLPHYVVLVDGLLNLEAEATLKHKASRLATKWKQPYLRTWVYVNIRVAITLVRATHCCIQGYWVSVHNISAYWPQWGDGSGLHLFH